MNEVKFCAGDILVPKAEEFPKHAIVVDGYDDKGRLRFHPLGGEGQARLDKFDASMFRLVEEWERAATLFRRAQFRLAKAGEVFTGWTNGETWNGWAMPRFEFVEAERFLKWQSGQNTPGGRSDAILAMRPDLPAPAPAAAGKEGFDAARDAFVTMAQDGEEELWPAEFVTVTDGTRMKVYALGAGAWIWEVVAGKRRQAERADAWDGWDESDGGNGGGGECRMQNEDWVTARPVVEGAARAEGWASQARHQMGSPNVLYALRIVVRRNAAAGRGRRTGGSGQRSETGGRLEGGDGARRHSTPKAIRNGGGRGRF